MPYDRAKAIDYARRFWERPCDDGFFWLSDTPVYIDRKRQELGAPEDDGWEARFQPDGQGAEEAVFVRALPDGGTDRKLIWPWAGLADCAHFLSRCLEAGGLSDVREISVPTLVKFLQGRAYTKTLAEQVDRDAGQRIVDSGILEPGDMLGYFNIDPNGDYGGAAQYSHSAMFVGKLSSDDDGRITCHTKSRFGGLSAVEDRWWLSDSYKYTFIHIGMNDPRPTAALAGWWSVPSDGATGYCLVSADGHARWTSNAPASSTARLDAPEDTAYWFQQGDDITFTWRRSGTVEVWTPGANAGEYDVSENGAPAGGTAAKVF